MSKKTKGTVRDYIYEHVILHFDIEKIPNPHSDVTRKAIRYAVDFTFDYFMMHPFKAIKGVVEFERKTPDKASKAP